MTDIAFHFNVPDRLSYACRLLRKAVARGSRIAVTGSVADLVAVDVALWAVSPTDFVTHCLQDASATALAVSSVVLVEDCRPHADCTVLLNLGANVPAAFDVFERVIEVVSHDEDERRLARAKWRFYAQAGWPLTQYDLQKAKS